MLTKKKARKTNNSFFVGVTNYLGIDAVIELYTHE